MAIIISKKGESAKIVERSRFKNEAMLQEYIQRNPEAIPIYELEEDKKLLVVKREFQTGSGPIDALAVDKEGDLYVVETKLYRNPDKRKVVAQVLDYGASLWKQSIEFNDFFKIAEDESKKKFQKGFREKVMEFFEIEDEETEEMMEALKNNLNEGIIKFVILMDSVGDRLKDLILYVNQNSRFDIYAVQLEYYEFEEHEIIIPSLFGIEVRKRPGVTEKFITYDSDSWHKELESRCSQEEVDVIRKFESYIKDKHFGISFSSKRKDERATFWIFPDEEHTCRILGFRVDGKIEFRFNKLKKCSPFDEDEKRREFAHRLNGIPEFDLPKSLTLTGIPKAPIIALRREDSLRKFVQELEWCAEEIRKARG